MKLKTLCIIPARSGSKEIKNKNIYKLFKNETLLETSIKFAKKLKFIDKIIVSTDSRDYLKIAKKILKSHSECLRPKKLSKAIRTIVSVTMVLSLYATSLVSVITRGTTNVFS